MADQFTTVTHRSWGGRLGGSLKGIFVGGLVFVLAFPLLFWNEGRAVRRYRVLKEGRGAVVSVSSDRVEPEREGALVHATGLARTDAVVSDPDFGVSVHGLQLERTVEMYQWKESSRSETRKKLGGGETTETTYTYSRDWSERPIDSSRFRQPEGHRNPQAMKFHSTTFTAPEGRLGAFSLSRDLVSRIRAFEPYPPDDGVESLPESMRETTKATQDGYYLGKNPSAPEVGDLLVRFAVVRDTDISLIAQQVGNGFTAYTTRSGQSLLELAYGIQTADEMFEQAEARNKFLTWILRVVGWLLMSLGLRAVFKPLVVFADVFPLLGTITGIGLGIVASLLAGILSIITMAVAWFVYRPLIGIVLLILAGVLVFWLSWAKRKYTEAPSTS